MPVSSRAIPQECLICEDDLPSGMALYRHLRGHHLEQGLYMCCDCDHRFNNLCKLSSHHLNHHCVKIVSCKYCQFHSTTKAKMHQHVRSHTTGVKYATYGKDSPQSLKY